MTDSNFETKVLERSRTYLTTLVYSCASNSPERLLKGVRAAQNLQQLHEGSQKFVNSMTVPQRQNAQAVLQRLVVAVSQNNWGGMLNDRMVNLFAVQFVHSTMFGSNAAAVKRQHYLPRCYIRRWSKQNAHKNGSVAVTGQFFAFNKFMTKTTVDSEWIHRSENGSLRQLYAPPLEHLFSRLELDFATAMRDPQDDNNLDALVLFAQTTALRLPNAAGEFTFKNTSQLAGQMNAFEEYWHAQVVKRANLGILMMTERPKPFIRKGVKSLVMGLSPTTALVLSTRGLTVKEASSLVVRDTFAKRHAAMRSGEVLYGLKV